MPRVLFMAATGVLAMYVPTCVPPAVLPTVAPGEARIAELWERPADVGTQDLFYGPWGPDVTMPYKADAFADLAAHVPGVQEVRNEVRALPASLFDDQLRYAVARQIYGDSLFARYATQLNPPVHIIVERGRVTLTGVVFSEVERQKAEAIARGTFSVMGVTNNLRIERAE